MINFNIYRAEVSAEDIEARIRLSLKGQGKQIALQRNPFPQDGLERLYPGFFHFTLWSLLGELLLEEITPTLEQKAPNRARVVFHNEQVTSIPGIWHAHAMIYFKFMKELMEFTESTVPVVR